MKMNKLAAGALALALGLGAVAPSVAAEKKEYTGAQLFLERYEKELKKVNALRDKALIAEEKIEAAEKRLDAAKERLAAAKKAYEALYPSHVFVLKDGKKGDKIEDYYTPGEVERRELDEATKNIAALVPAKTFNGMDVVNRFKSGAEYDVVLKENQKYVAGQYEGNPDVLEAAVRRFVNAAYDYYKNTKADSPRILAYQELVAAQGERDAAETNYRTVFNKYDQDRIDYNKALTKLTEDAKGYGYVVQIGNNGLKLVKDGEAKVESPKKFNIEQLKAARAKALTTLDAVKLLEELAPQKIAGVKAELNKLVEEQKALIKLADKYLAKEMALVSTAYAAEDEEEMSPEELTNKLNEKSDKIQDLIKDKEEDKKPEEKPEDKKPEEEKKPEENKPAKKSGNNARTGIAGVAGVAGILAAASVAYAASKRD